MTEIVSLRQRAVRPRFAWLLPLLFTLASAGGAVCAGKSGQLFCLGALPGIWACCLVDSGAGPTAWVWPTLAAGVPLSWVLGRLLDRLEADVRLWVVVLLPASALAGYLLLQGYADLDAAMVHHGSWLAVAICALQLGSYCATLVLLALAAGRGGAR